MDYKAILNLMKEMNLTELTKVEIEEEGLRICIEKATPVITAAQPQLPAYAAGTAVSSPSAASFQPIVQVAQGNTVASVTLPVTETTEKLPEDAGTKKIVAPMVGTFYSQPAPDKPSFVKVGDQVKKGQTICIIEAMKLMNEIESEHDGEIVKVLVNNEGMVEFGQPLFLIK